MRSPLLRILAPLACLVLLAGMFAEQSTHATAQTAEPYHAAARTALDAVPWRLEGGAWAAQAVDLPEPALRLLRPNAYLSRRYVYTGTDPHRDGLAGSLLVVQCRLSRDMLGHYPRNCYPGNGWELVDSPITVERTVGTRKIPTTEYRFLRFERGQQYTQWVMNFLIVPGKGVFPDIQEVEEAAEDYQQRYFGAAQFQIVLNDALSKHQKDLVVQTLLDATGHTIETMLSGGLR